MKKVLYMDIKCRKTQEPSSCYIRCRDFALCRYNQFIINSKETKRKAERLIGCGGSVGGCQNSGQYLPPVQDHTSIQEQNLFNRLSKVSLTCLFFLFHFPHFVFHWIKWLSLNMLHATVNKGNKNSKCAEKNNNNGRAERRRGQQPLSASPAHVEKSEVVKKRCTVYKNK